MRQPRVPVFPESLPPDAHDAQDVFDPLDPPAASGRPNLTERVAGWSARHRKSVVLGWLLIVAIVFAASQALGAKNLPTYDAGQSGQTERVLNKAAPAQYNAPGSGRGPTPDGYRSLAAAVPPPGRPGCGRRWPAGWSPGR